MRCSQIYLCQPVYHCNTRIQEWQQTPAHATALSVHACNCPDGPATSPQKQPRIKLLYSGTGTDTAFGLCSNR